MRPRYGHARPRQRRRAPWRLQTAPGTAAEEAEPGWCTWKGRSDKAPRQPAKSAKLQPLASVGLFAKMIMSSCVVTRSVILSSKKAQEREGLEKLETPGQASILPWPAIPVRLRFEPHQISSTLPVPFGRSAWCQHLRFETCHLNPCCRCGCLHFLAFLRRGLVGLDLWRRTGRTVTLACLNFGRREISVTRDSTAALGQS